MAANSNNAYRLSKLLVDGGTYFARELLLEEIGKQGFTSFDSFLNDPSVKNTLQQLKRRKILKNEQMILLYPQASNVDINQLDITLLTCILTNCCQLQQPEEDAVKRLRDLRNTVYGHHPVFSIPDNLFQKYWTDIKTLLEKGSNAYLKSACGRFLQDLIKRVESEILSPEDGERYLNGLIESNMQMVGSLKEKLIKQDTNLNRLNVSISEMNTNQEFLHESIKEKIDKQESKFDSIRRQLGSIRTVLEEIMIRQQTHELKGSEDTGNKASNLHNEWLEEKIRASRKKVGEIMTITETASEKGLETIPVATMDAISSVLEKEHMVVLNGLAGSGKTFLGLYVLGEKEKQGYTPVIIRSCIDLKSFLFASEQQYVVLIDDVLGQFRIDNGELNIMNQLSDGVISAIQNSRILLVFTIRVNILKSVTKKQSSSKVLLKANFDVTHDAFNKGNIVRFYAGMKDIDIGREQIQILSQTQPAAVGFPFLCSHMCGNYEHIKTLFDKPTDFIKYDLIECNTKDDTEFFILLLVIMTCNHLNFQTLAQYRNEIEQIRSKYKSFPVELSDLQSVTEHFVGTYLQEEGGVYRFVHSYIIEAVYETALNLVPDLLIAISPIEYINNFTPLFEQAKQTWAILIDRFSYERNTAEVAKCSVWQNCPFFEDVLIQRGTSLFFEGRNREEESLFEFFCTYSSNSTIEQILLNTTDQRDRQIQLVIERGLKAACVSGRLDILESLLSHSHVQITADLILSVVESPECVSVIEFLLINGGNVQAKNSAGENILILAAKNKNACLIDYLFGFKEQEMVRMTKDAISDEFLILAVESGSEALIKAVRDEMFSNGNMDDLITITASLGDAQTFLHVIGNDLLHMMDEDGWNLLHKAAMVNSVVIVECLIERGISHKSKTSEHYNILHIASACGSTEVVKYILHKFKDIAKDTDIDGWNSLHYAAYGNSVECFDLLIDAGVNIEAKTTFGANVVHIATMFNSIEILEELLLVKKDMFHTTDDAGCNAFHYAAVRSTTETFIFLEMSGADINTKTSQGLTTMHLAAMSGNTGVLKYITQMYYLDQSSVEDYDNDGFNALHYSVLLDNKDCFDQLVKAGMDISRQTRDGRTSLHLAVQSDNVEILQQIKVTDKDILLTKDSNNWNYLHYAAKYNTAKSFTFLLDAGVKPDSETPDGLNILHIAAMYKNTGIIKTIVHEYPLLIETTDNEGWNALHHSSASGCLKCFQYLLEVGMKIDSTTDDGRCVMHIAASNDQEHILKYLVQTKSDILFAIDNDGCNALHHAAFGISRRCLDFLINVRIDPYSKTCNGRTLLHLAVFSDYASPSFLRYIISRYKKLLHTVDKKGRNALHYTHVSGSSEIIECIDFLIDQGIKPHSKDKNGCNLLHLAVEVGHRDIIRYMLTFHRQLLLKKDGRGRNVFDIARGNPKIEDLLNSFSK